MPRGVYARPGTKPKIQTRAKPAAPAISGEILTGEERQALWQQPKPAEPTGGQPLVAGILTLIESLSADERRQVAHALINLL